MGSPPPTRGTLVVKYSRVSQGGITPAYAGNTDDDRGYDNPVRDHPRLRGEHRTTVHPVHLYPGSPPPTRGTPDYNSYVELNNRITPAYAGNTSVCSPNFISGADHPRLRGEHVESQDIVNGRIGSPPPTRGTLEGATFIDAILGITPAYAGNTALSKRYGQASKDHPRLRGEHFVSSSKRVSLSGSPPPTRGTRLDGWTNPSNPGITPAYAGNTTSTV